MTRRPAMNRRRAARFGAVQALYQLDVAGGLLPAVLAEFERHRLTDLLEPLGLEEPPARVDREWFAKVTRGAWTKRSELDPMIEQTLAPGWTLDRAGYLLRAFLRAGAFELASCPDVPARVAISEYVELAHGFLPAEEAGFVNAVLDHLARRLRPEHERRAHPQET